MLTCMSAAACARTHTHTHSDTHMCMYTQSHARNMHRRTAVYLSPPGRLVRFIQSGFRLRSYNSAVVVIGEFSSEVTGIFDVALWMCMCVLQTQLVVCVCVCTFMCVYVVVHVCVHVHVCVLVMDDARVCAGVRRCGGGECTPLCDVYMVHEPIHHHGLEGASCACLTALGYMSCTRAQTLNPTPNISSDTFPPCALTEYFASPDTNSLKSGPVVCVARND